MPDYPSSHHAAQTDVLPVFESLKSDRRFDVCIIGAGYTGVSAALHLTELGYSVAVVEAQRVGWGASGRNGGQLGYAMTPLQPDLISRLGETNAKALWDLSVEAVDLFHSLCAKHDIDCDFVSGNTGCAITQSDADYLKEHADIVASYGYDTYDVLDAAQAQKLSGSPHFKGAIRSQKSGHINPLKYLLGLCKAACTAGVTFYENTPAQSVDYKDPAIIKCPEGKITANFVLLACNGYLGALHHSMGKRILPVDNYQAATVPLNDAQLSTLIKDGGCIWDTSHSVHYFRITPDRRLVMGCGIGIPGRPPRNIEADCRRHIEYVYPQLQGVGIDYVWGGTLGGTLRELPDVGLLSPNAYYAQGYTGHGVAIAPLVGRDIANAIHSESTGFDTLSNIEHVNIPGGRTLRLPLVIAYRLLTNTRDHLNRKLWRV
jgi:gamma-glutamylputrescine oxidase